jgi:hypothetical protein
MLGNHNAFEKTKDLSFTEAKVVSKGEREGKMLPRKYFVLA